MKQVLVIGVLHVIVTIVSGLVPSSAILNPDWLRFKRQYKKHYTVQEDLYRYVVWQKHNQLISRHNRETLNGLHTYTMAANQFTDMTSEEFISTMMGFKRTEKEELNAKELSAPGKLPDAVDWKAKGYVTEVGNQGACGSCWAFTATGALEGQHKKKTGNLADLSEQNLMDCSQKQGNMGCEGGTMDLSFKYVKQNGGIDTEASYPYTSTGGQIEKCKFNKTTVAATCTGFVDLPPGNETALQVAVATVGPIAVAVDASRPGFQFYKKGVFDDPKCNPHAIEHSLVITGYGTENGKQYWECKNSWGTSWGNEGYVRMVRNKDNQCGIASLASYPTV